MRATWPGARSGRIRIVTGPLEVSRRSVLPSSASGFWVMGGFCFLYHCVFRYCETPLRDVDRGIAERPGDCPRYGFGSPRRTAASSGRSPALRTRVSLMATTKGRPAMAPPNLSVSGSGVQCLRSEEHTSELQSLRHLVCRLLLEKKKNK